MITSTRFTDLVGCALPLQLAATGGVGTTELAIAPTTPSPTSSASLVPMSGGALAEEFLSFVRKLDREFPKSLDMHVLLDNASTHSHTNVRAWLDPCTSSQPARRG